MLGSALSGLGYASWIVLPTYAGFALGFILWGTSSALISGTLGEGWKRDLAKLRDLERQVEVVGICRERILRVAEGGLH